MKQLVGFLILAGAYTYANDGGMPYIETKTLTFVKADIGSKITFSGKDAISLYNALPVLDTSNARRGFAVKGAKKAVFIRCENSVWDAKKEEFTPVVNPPICTIEIAKTFTPGDYGDDGKWVNDRTPQSETKSTIKKK